MFLNCIVVLGANLLSIWMAFMFFSILEFPGFLIAFLRSAVWCFAWLDFALIWICFDVLT